ncbi:MAG: hypothetical protein ABIH42_08285, partial [Planctomycetota bacterium]
MIKKGDLLFLELAVNKGFITQEQQTEVISIIKASKENTSSINILVDKAYMSLSKINEILDEIKGKTASTEAKDKTQVKETIKDMSFGKIAMAKGFINENDINNCIKEQRERMSRGLNQRIGEVCIDMGSLSREQVKDILKVQVRKLSLGQRMKC